MRRILELEHQVAALAARNDELQAELDATREALRRSRATVDDIKTVPALPSRLPVLRDQAPCQAVVVWRRGSR